MRASLHDARSSKQRQCTTGRSACSRRAVVRPVAFLNKLWPARNSKSSSNERLAYKESEMFEIAPGVKVAPMGLGTWSWGNRFLWGYDPDQDQELQQVFNLMVSKGINLFDTADSYGTGDLNGRSEQLLGQFTREYPGSERTRSNIHIATKLAAYPWRLTPGQFVSACKGSLKRLGADQLTLGQLHWSTAKYAPLQEQALRGGLVELYQQGLVRAVGVSNYGPNELRSIHAYLAKHDVPLATAQIQFSLLSRTPEALEAQAVCKDLGITMIAYSPLALGLLSGKYTADSLPKGPRGQLFRGLLPKVQPVLEVVEEVAQARNKTMGQVAINWAICKGTIPIPGSRNLQQAEEALGAMGWRLSTGEISELEAAADKCPTIIQNIFATK